MNSTSNSEVQDSSPLQSTVFDEKQNEKQMFAEALHFLAGKNGRPRDWEKAREMLEVLYYSSNHVPSGFLFGFIVRWGLSSKATINENLGREIMNKTALIAKPYFENTPDPLGFSDFAIGLMYYAGYGVAEDEQEALKSFKKAASNGNEFAEMWLGKILGDIVRNPNTSFHDYSLGFLWTHKATLASNPMAQVQLGLMMQHDPNPQENDAFGAFSFYKRSANQGFALGMFMVSLFFDDPTACDHACVIDPQKSLHYATTAAELGLSLAQHRLGIKYEHGIGVQKDLEQAKYWYGKAAQSNQESKVALERLKSFEN